MLRYFNLAIFVFLPLILKAQKGDQSATMSNASKQESLVWKRKVSRKIDTRDSFVVGKGSYKKKFGDTILNQFLIDAVIEGRLVAYEDHGNYDGQFSNRLSVKNLRRYLFPPPDTIGEPTPTGDSVITKIYNNYYKKENIEKFRTLEEWRFNVATRQMEFQILGIAPLKDIYTDGDYRGSQAIFWLNWKDVSQLLMQYATAHLQNNLQQYLWADYFRYNGLSSDSTDIDKSTGKIWKRNAFRNIIIYDTDGNCYRHLGEQRPRNSLFELIYDSLMQGKLKAYYSDRERFGTVLPIDSIKLDAIPDTIEIDYNIKKVIYHDIELSIFNNYTLMEQWLFDPEAGKTTISIFGIQPILQSLDHTRLPNFVFNHKFWFRYSDVKDIITQFDEYIPLNGFTATLWQSYFSADQQNCN